MQEGPVRPVHSSTTHPSPELQTYRIENPENFILARYQYHVSARFYKIDIINEGHEPVRDPWGSVHRRSINSFDPSS